MGATDAVNVVDESLTDEQRADLAIILQKRKEELQRALVDVEAAIKRLQRKRYRRQEHDDDATESDSEDGQSPNTER
jgi:Skp family chaperone for outer membrane proteins